MPKLTERTLVVANIPNTSNVIITAEVTATFTNQEKQFMDLFKVKYKLRCQVWGKDEGEDAGQLNGDNDPLDIPYKAIWISGNFTKKFIWDDVPSRKLDEDDFFQDEIIARFTCTPQNTGLLLSAATPKFSNTVRGSF